MRAWMIALVVTVTAGSSLCASPVAYQKMKVGRTWVHVVTVDLNNTNTKVAAGMSRLGRGSSERFSSIVSRTHPKAAMTGTFFDTRSLLPIGDIATNGCKLHSGYFRTSFCISKDNKALLFTRKRGKRPDWNGFDTVLCGGITLLRNGAISLAPRSEGFRDPALFRPNRRTAVGVTTSGKLLFVSVNHRIYLRHLACVMMKLKAVDAFALDGGSSSALYYSGKSVTTPARKLTNVLLVYDDVSAYEKARTQFAPTILLTKTLATKSVMAYAPRSARSLFNDGFIDGIQANDSLWFSGATASAPLVREPRTISAYNVSFSAGK